jgi:hypothetical protein
MVMTNATFNGAGLSVVEGHGNRRTYGLSSACHGNRRVRVMFASRMTPTICARDGL